MFMLNFPLTAPRVVEQISTLVVDDPSIMSNSFSRGFFWSFVEKREISLLEAYEPVNFHKNDRINDFFVF